MKQGRWSEPFVPRLLTILCQAIGSRRGWQNRHPPIQVSTYHAFQYGMPCADWSAMPRQTTSPVAPNGSNPIDRSINTPYSSSVHRASMVCSLIDNWPLRMDPFFHRTPELLRIAPFACANDSVMTQGILEASDDYELTPV